MASPLNDPKLEALLDRLHAQSDTQINETDTYFARREREGSIDYDNYCDDDMQRFLAEKLVALERVSENLRPGAIVVCDNTAVDVAEYRDYFEFINDPGNRFRTMTVPFQGGFELSVRV